VRGVVDTGSGTWDLAATALTAERQSSSSGS
jgi:hypothetical protein